MKNIILSSVALLLFAITGCDKNDDNGVDPVTPTNVNETVVKGTWRITSYLDNGTDKTTDFAGYNFTFLNDGSVQAINGILTLTGTWSTESDSGNTKLNIGFSSPDKFEDISEDWVVISRTDTEVKLKHESGGSGGTDFLTFTKN